MTDPTLQTLIQQELPQLIAQDPLIRDFILRTVSEYYASKPEIESRFDRVLNELQRDREEQTRKWEEQKAENARRWEEVRQLREEQARKWEEQKAEDARLREEQARKWEEQKAEDARLREEQARKWEEQKAEDARLREEQARKWEENSQQINHFIAELQKASRQYDSTIGALGSRWGLNSEASFRNALKGILEDSFEIEVLNVTDYDEDGEVFGRPDQVEIDVIIKNGVAILCEIKSSFSKSDMYIFDRKVAFYQKRHQRPVTRKLIISPMVDSRALPVAEKLGIEVYSGAHRVENL